jgi:hypothetical protein
MSRLETPLLYRTLWATGDVLLRAKLKLLLKTTGGIWKPLRFIVDSGSEITTMSAFAAKRLGLPMPQKASLGVLHQPTGLAIRSGSLQARIAAMDQTEYAFPCIFLGDPDTPVNPSLPSARVPQNLLGLAGVVDKVRITFDGEGRPGAAYGYLVIDRR